MQITINDRKYSSWEPQSERITDPFAAKIFHEDEINEETLQIIKSPTRENKSLAGVLILENNKTYGRTPNKKKLYYICRPHNKHLPDFLVPYEPDIGFEKVFKNKFVLFQFDHWETTEKHPYGLLTETIGDIDKLPAYYKYQIYAKNLNVSNTQMKKYMKHVILDSKTIESKYMPEMENDKTRFGHIEDRVSAERNIFTIDSEDCTDRDDAISISQTTNQNVFHVHVYISNVWIWIEYFNLYSLLQNTNVSTIYMPDHPRHMLPTEFTEKILSLNQNQTAYTMTMDFHVDIDKNIVEPIHQTICQTKIRIHKNFAYESAALKKYPAYQVLLNVSKRLDPTIQDSHEVVAYWMIQMNSHVAKMMYSKQIGIYRSSISKNPQYKLDKSHVKNSENMFLQIWEHAVSGKYIAYDKDLPRTQYAHSLLQLPIYTHFTSPMRRMVDLYNQFIWMSVYVSHINPKIHTIFDTETLEKLNKHTKVIRKIQNECTLLHQIQQKSVDNTIYTSGIILNFEEDKKTKKTNICIYIPEYKTVLITKNIETHHTEREKINIEIKVFEREENKEKKIRISKII